MISLATTLKPMLFWQMEHRLLALLMTAFVAALGFVPMAFNVGIGAEGLR